MPKVKGMVEKWRRAILVDAALSALTKVCEDVKKVVQAGPKQGPSSPKTFLFRVSLCAARTLNATGQSRVTLSLR